MDWQDLFTVKIATKEEVLDGDYTFNDINVVWIFTFNSNRDFSLLEFSIVTFLLIISILITIIGIFCASKANCPHRNHRLIVIAGISCWFELVISKLLVFYYQYWNGDKNDKIPESSKILFWAALFRYHYMFFGVHTVLSVTVERAMATWLIRDYEKKSRLFISLSLIITNFLFSTVYSFLAVQQLIKMKLMFLNTLITTLSAIIILEIIFFMNRRRLRSFNQNDKILQYTLSIRYQLQENVQSCKLIRAAVITVGSLIILIILTECLPVILAAPDDVRRWCNLVFDTITHINAILVVPTIVVLIDGFRRVFIDFFWRKTLKMLKVSKTRERRKSIFGFSKKFNQNQQNDGDVYFEMFNKSVNSAK